MVPSREAARCSGCGRGSAKECYECAERRERATERVPHHGNRWSSGLRRVEKRALTGGTNRRGISLAQPALNKVPRSCAAGCSSFAALYERVGIAPRWKLDNGGDVVHGANEAQVGQRSMALESSRVGLDRAGLDEPFEPLEPAGCILGE
jgi:hypothetical protein